MIDMQVTATGDEEKIPSAKAFLCSDLEQIFLLLELMLLLVEPHEYTAVERRKCTFFTARLESNRK